MGVRDVHEIEALGTFSVFSRAVSCKAGTFAEIGDCQETISCGRVVVSPGDWIVADQNGIVVVPAALKEEALAAAKEIHEKEECMARHLKDGASLSDAYEAWQKSRAAR